MLWSVLEGVQALAVFVSPSQWLPMKRIAELLSCQVFEGALATWIHEVARTRGPTMLLRKKVLLAQQVDPVDETGGRVTGEARMSVTSPSPHG